MKVNEVTMLSNKITYMTATNKGEVINVDWQTATEMDISHFTIQHSMDGISFTDIGVVKAKGSGTNDYQFSDSKPTNGINYYRLQSVDKDGVATYSKVVSAQLMISGKQLTVYPNPGRDKVTIGGEHISSVQVVNNWGRVVSVQTLHDASNPSLSISGLPAGIYHLRIQTIDGKVSRVGFEKKREL